MKSVLLSAFVVLVAASVIAAPARRPRTVPKDEDTPATVKVTEDMSAVARGGNEFAFDLYAKVAAGGKGNAFLSPTSLHTALAVTHAGAGGSTADQMAKTLHCTLATPKLAPAFGDLLKALNTPNRTYDKRPAYELVVANALWPQKKYALKADFTASARTHYGAEVQPLDYSKPDPARATINEWAESKTADRIKDLIPAGLLKAQTRLVLTNAIYFKSNWAHAFEKSDTKDRPFQLGAGKSAKVPTMYQEDTFAYAETEDFQAMELPYLFGDLSMFVFLPKKADGLGELEKMLSGKVVQEWVRRLQRERVQVLLPRFRFTSQFLLARALAEMGMTDAFSDTNADFSGMTSAEGLFLAEVIHKAYIDVHEKGAEAAAATAIMAVAPNGHDPASRPKPKLFNADRPFFFLIRHNATESILFVGRVTDPRDSNP